MTFWMTLIAVSFAATFVVFLWSMNFNQMLIAISVVLLCATPLRPFGSAHQWAGTSACISGCCSDSCCPSPLGSRSGVYSVPPAWPVRFLSLYRRYTHDF